MDLPNPTVDQLAQIQERHSRLVASTNRLTAAVTENVLVTFDTSADRTPPDRMLQEAKDCIANLADITGTGTVLYLRDILGSSSSTDADTEPVKKRQKLSATYSMTSHRDENAKQLLRAVAFRNHFCSAADFKIIIDITHPQPN